MTPPGPRAASPKEVGRARIGGSGSSQPGGRYPQSRGGCAGACAGVAVRSPTWTPTRAGAGGAEFNLSLLRLTRAVRRVDSGASVCASSSPQSLPRCQPPLPPRGGSWGARGEGSWGNRGSSACCLGHPYLGRLGRGGWGVCVHACACVHICMHVDGELPPP